MSALTVTGGRLIDPASGIDRVADLYVCDGRVAGVGTPPPGWVDAERIDAHGHWVLPGLVDLSVRLREPGEEYKATLESELRAATAGGVTTLVCPPDTDPPLDEPGLVDMLVRRAADLGQACVLPLGALTVGLAGQRLTEMAELAEAGCVGFYQGLKPISDTRVLLSAMQYAATFGFTVWLTPIEPWLMQGGVALAGEMATRLGLVGIPPYAESLALAQILRIAEATGVRLHVARVATAEGAGLLRAAKARGLQVTADVAIHHLHLSDRDIGDFDGNYRVFPPFADPRDRAELSAAVADGTIDAIASDHAPLDDDAKLLPFAEAVPGVSAVELLLPLTLRWAQSARVPLARAVDALTAAPARVLGISCSLAPGAVADLIVVDPSSPWRVTRAALLSQGLNTPFMQHEMSGRVRWVVRKGAIIHRASARIA